MLRMTRPLLLAALVAVSAAGCETTDLFGPTEPLPDPTTVVVRGTVTPNGAFTHPFYTNAFGTVTATLVGLEPAETTIGLALGTFNGVACSVVLSNDAATTGLVLTGNVGAAGGLCLRLYDANGSLTGPVNFEVQIVHP